MTVVPYWEALDTLVAGGKIVFGGEPFIIVAPYRLWREIATGIAENNGFSPRAALSGEALIGWKSVIVSCDSKAQTNELCVMGLVAYAKENGG